MKYTNEMRADGQMAMRYASSKAFEAYSETDPLEVYEYENMDGEKMYAYKDVDGITDGLTFEELERELENLWDIYNNTDVYDEA